jgi:hypothetical protein
MKHRLSYSVTFEFPERAPVTHRGVIEATTAAAASARAIRAAQKILKPKNWSSLVFVILERSSVAPGAARTAVLVETGA